MASDYTSPNCLYPSEGSAEVQPVDIAPVADCQDKDQQSRVFNRVQQPIGADSNSKHVVGSDYAPGGRGKGIEAEGLARTNQSFAIDIVYSS